jgi:hypothetical protein
MTSSPGWVERLLGWAVGARSAEPGPQRPGRLAPVRANAANEHEVQERYDRDREIELRVLMSTWM